MLEKELKVLEINRSEIESVLIELWAEKTFEGCIHDVYYDFPHDDEGHKMELNGRMFRLRRKWTEHIYTIKNKRKEIKKAEKVVAKDEHETEISNIESFSKVLEKYGMQKTREKKKYRISYRLDGVEFDFDDYEWIPELLEIEAHSWDAIRSWIQKLWLSEYTILKWGSRKLFKHYNIPYTFHN